MLIAEVKNHGLYMYNLLTCITYLVWKHGLLAQVSQYSVHAQT